MQTMEVRITLADFLERNKITAYKLVKAVEKRAAQGSIYALARGDSTRIDLKTLGVVMDALEKMTEKPVAFDDLLERVKPRDPNLTAAGVPYTGDEETDAVLNSSPDILERIKLVQEGYTKTMPLRIVIDAATKIRPG